MSTISIAPTDTKRCFRCGDAKPLLEFAKHSRLVLRNECKPCVNERKRIQYETDERVRAQKADYREKNREKTREYCRRYDANRREEHKSRAKQYRLNNLDLVRKRDRERSVRDKAKRKAAEARRKAANPEHFLALHRAGYLRHAEKRRAEKAIYRAANRDNVNACLAKWREAHREEDRQKSRDWRRNNPEKHAAIGAKKRAQKRGARIGSDRGAYIAFVKLMRSDAVISCYWCRTKTTKGKRHRDHIIPLSKGGSDSVSNLCCSCIKCNLSKQSKLPEQFTGQFEIAFPVM